MVTGGFTTAALIREKEGHIYRACNLINNVPHYAIINNIKLMKPHFYSIDDFYSERG